jgi:predicted CoA-binding protein
MTTKSQIDQFLSTGPMAMAGVSRNPKKFGRIAFEELTKRGLQIYPVNPNLDELNGVKCYHSVSELPADTKALIIMTRKDQTAGVVREALDKGITNLWIQQSSDTPEALALLKNRDINAVTKQCILMHHKPGGMHKFHRNLKKFFGALPR